MIQKRQICSQKDISISPNPKNLMDLYKTTPLLKRNAMHHDSKGKETYVN